MYVDDWYKKDVTLRWGGLRLELAVAQELFSSHDVDGGSLLLLRSLAIEGLSPQGRCLDYGCGYGVLGLAIASIRPEWEVVLVDRDALAVAFTEHNADKLGLTVDSVIGLDPAAPSGGEFDLVLWNVPGKAGERVLARLMADTIDALAPDGVLALVIVHPLAETVRAVAMARPDAEILIDTKGPEHTVLHVRKKEKRDASAVFMRTQDAFDRGIFDREAVLVEHGIFDYEIMPVIGLPQYDGPDFTSLMLMDGLAELRGMPKKHVLVMNPGVGHIATSVGCLWPEAVMDCVGRDELALRSSARAYRANTGDSSTPYLFAAADLADAKPSFEPWDLAIVTLDNQTRLPVMRRLLDDLQSNMMEGGHIVVGGDSTEVTRMLGLAKKSRGLRERDRTKRKGVSMAVVEILPGKIQTISS